LLLCENWPDTLTLVIGSATDPVFVIVMICGPLGTLSPSLPNASVLGANA
jgi:hypothetical protein